jgi:2-polyprenyl-3-methyl-5-hydroxy-6-metoxy-1,4-benzoquinol methylase
MPGRTCPSCTQTDAPLAFRARDYNRRVTDETFDYYRCPTCGLIFLSPIPSDIGRYYPRDYYAIPQSRGELRAKAQKWQQWKLKLVQKFKTGGRLLEIGPAYGLFASLAQDAGFDVSVIEMDSDCCAFLRNVVGINVVQNPDTVAAVENLPLFDVIAIWQVIEHLAQPWKVVEAAAHRLAPGGVLIMDTPNPGAFQFGVLGKYWTHLDAPRHVVLIPAALLVDRAKAAGLSLISLSAADASANGFNGFGWGETFQNVIGENALGRAVNFLGRALAKLLIPIERTGFRGSTYTTVFQRPGRT